MKITSCPITGSSESVEFLDLGLVPLVNNLCRTKTEAINCKKYPLSIQYFPESKLTCLKEIVNKDKLFLNYLYQSGVNQPYLDHCSEMYDYLNEFIGFDFVKDNYVIDIGGNDGSLLYEFAKKNNDLTLLNIDASRNFIQINKDKGIRYLNVFFDEHTRLRKKADLITSTNVFQHTWPIRSFVRGICKNLTKNGVWCLEFPYLLTTVANDNYDQVYHEHVYYYLLKNIVDLLDQEGMRPVDVSYHPIHAGTLRVLSVKKDSFITGNSTVSSFLNLEDTITLEYLKKWGKRTQGKIQLFKNFIGKLTARGKTIYGFGAAAKGCVFLNTVGLDYNIIPYIIDDTPFKQGKFVPGTGIKIVDRSILKVEKVDFIIILAHNFRDYIIESLRDEYNGRFIVMFPDIMVI